MTSRPTTHDAQDTKPASPWPAPVERVQFFHGQPLNVDDLETSHGYHREQWRTHRRLFFGAGVHRQRGQTCLRVRRHPERALCLEVEPGYAFDSHGRELRLARTGQLDLSSYRSSKQSLRLAVVLESMETAVDFYEDEAMQGVAGYRRVREGCRLQVFEYQDASQTPEQGLLLALVSVSPARPELGQDAQIQSLDCSVLKVLAGSATSLDPAKSQPLVSAFQKAQELLRSQAQIPDAAQMRALLQSLEWRLVSQELTLTALLNAQKILAQRGRDWLSRLSMSTESLDRPRWQLLHSAIDQLSRHCHEGLAMQLDVWRHLIEAMKSCFDPDSKARESTLEFLAPSQGDFEEPEETIATLESLPASTSIPWSIEVEGQHFERIEEVKFTNEEVLKAHAVELTDTDSWSQEFRSYSYPDGTIRAAFGVHFKGGRLSFELSEVEPNKALLLVRRVHCPDKALTTRLTVQDQDAGSWTTGPSERAEQWVNGARVIDASLINGHPLKFGLHAEDQGQVELFGLWVFQARG